MNTVTETQIKHMIANGVLVDVTFTPIRNEKDKYISVVRVNEHDSILHTQKGLMRKFTAKAAINWSRELKIGNQIVFDAGYNQGLTT